VTSMYARAAALAVVTGLAACRASPAAQQVPVVVLPPPEAPAPPPSAPLPSTEPAAEAPPTPLHAPTAEPLPETGPQLVAGDEGLAGGVAVGVVTGSIPSGAVPASSAQRARPVNRDWKCKFPPEADPAEVDTAVVVLKISVDAKGKIDHVVVVKDPGYGFGQAARLCALRQAFLPATDEHGKPVPDSHLTRVRFVR
jgi:periplasmic protein TonB